MGRGRRKLQLFNRNGFLTLRKACNLPEPSIEPFLNVTAGMIRTDGLLSA